MRTTEARARLRDVGFETAVGEPFEHDKIWALKSTRGWRMGGGRFKGGGEGGRR